ncbi:hypothetical protein [Acinetobacter populi]|uniref:Uncharacterized protein n=1 Tax=Acinetobacter populi TaxID=1582270 RepID=A0A1Z9Z2P6_9GAMM|nr:hypothetical protein [Acinetobacter populi]OUY08725.1 hypothetical protein CAP51_03680 [Acinetobacter populi]
MVYTFEYGKQFANEFARYPEDQQDAIIDFTDIYELYGLSDFSKYKGKITPSWKGVDFDSFNYQYAYEHKLWHYHIGIPEYVKSLYRDYYTSDWVLHFIKVSDQHIVIVDVLFHYKADGHFHLPKEKYLEY